LGYPYCQKAYKLYDLEAKKVFISRDVLFHEQYFPFLQKDLGNHSSLPLPIYNNFDNLSDYFQPPQQSSTPAQSSHQPSTSQLRDSVPPQSLTENTLSPHLSSTGTLFQPRKSTRSHKTPIRLQDYVCSQVQTSWCNLVSVSPTYSSCLSAIEDFPEPATYEQAVKHPGWVEAMKKEIQALQINNTWEEVPLPSNKKAISCKWIYKTKLKADGTLERLKARLVIRGFT